MFHRKRKMLKPLTLERDYGIIQRNEDYAMTALAKLAYEMTQEDNPLVAAYGAGFIKYGAMRHYIKELT